MKAKDLMIRNVVSVKPETPVRTAVELIMENQYSALPVVDKDGMLVGIISEGDLIGETLDVLIQKRDWWLDSLSEGDEMSPEFLSYVKKADIPVKQFMKTQVITADEETNIDDVARLLVKHRVKRVPVVREGRVVGIISRADLMHLVAKKLKSI